jgi:hypothetical protein
MNAAPRFRVRRIASLTGMVSVLGLALASPGFGSSYGRASEKAAASTVKVSLSEWKVQLSPARVPAGAVTFEVKNAGTIPHAFEVEGHGLEKSVPQLQPGGTATLTLNLRTGSYEAYCPVGKGSHKMLGMMNHLLVGNAKASAATDDDDKGEKGEKYESGHEMAMGHAMKKGGDDDEDGEYGGAVKTMKVAGGGPVIQILPGPFPFADSAAVVIKNRPPDQQADLTHKAQMGPYSNNVAPITGDISLVAIDHGASGDSVSGVAQFTAKDGARWKVVMDRVQTKDIPFNPRFGGVIMGLFYHGASGVHTPLVPTIQSSLALWAFAHLYKNDQLVADNAMVHIMLLSRTRRTSDWALDCWDCSDRPIEELQLQVTSAPNSPPIDAPGGFLFVNWEKSSGQLAKL